MAVKVSWSPRAHETFDEILDDLAERYSDEVAARFLRQAFEQIDRIAAFPKSSPAIDKRPDIRCCVVNSYVSLFYRITRQNEVELITFFPNRGNPADLVLDQ